MASDNTEIARRACEAAWQRPRPDFDTLNELAHPDHEMFPIQSLVEGGDGYRGAAGFRKWLVSWTEMFGEDWKSTVEDATAVGDEQVLISGLMKARGVGGGVPVEEPFWLVMDVREGKVARSAIFTKREQALEAVGLEE
jgi:ketosteroid isomerase-like protein